MKIFEDRSRITDRDKWAIENGYAQEIVCAIDFNMPFEREKEAEFENTLKVLKGKIEAYFAANKGKDIIDFIQKIFADHQRAIVRIVYVACPDMQKVDQAIKAVAKWLEGEKYVLPIYNIRGRLKIMDGRLVLKERGITDIQSNYHVVDPLDILYQFEVSPVKNKSE